MSTTTNTPSRTIAELAKASLKHLAERRLQPTPQNYAQAWVAAGGTLEEKRDDPRREEHKRDVQFAVEIVRALVDTRLIDRDHAARLSPLIEEHRLHDVMQMLTPMLQRHLTPVWAALIEDLVRGMELVHRGWTRARKREALSRVIEGSGSRDDLLAERLRGLLESWHKEPLEERIEIAPSPETGEAALVTGAISQHDMEQARNQRNTQLLNEMGGLLGVLCDSLAAVSEDTSWIRGQAEVLRSTLSAPSDHRSIAQVRMLLAQTAEAQRNISSRRRESLDELKRMLSQWLESVGSVSDTADAFNTRIAGYAERIQSSDSVDSLASTVQSLMEDTQRLRTTIDSSRSDFESTRSRAFALEDEVSRLEQQLAAASKQMVTDNLTNTMNRRGLEEAFETMHAASQQTHAPLAMALLDVDDFKKLNDALGHQAGDEALKHLAQILKEKSRPSDAISRYGGEEFVLLLPDMDVEQAAVHMARLQRELTSHVFLHESRQAFITFSAGVTQVSPQDQLAGAINRADEAMYSAKRAGKNCVRTAGNPRAGAEPAPA